MPKVTKIKPEDRATSRQTEKWPIQIPMWVLEASAREFKTIAGVMKNPHTKALLKAAETPATRALAKLIKDNPRRNETWFINQMKANEGLRDAAVEAFVQGNASRLFLKFRPGSKA